MIVNGRPQRRSRGERARPAATPSEVEGDAIARPGVTDCGDTGPQVQLGVAHRPQQHDRIGIVRDDVVIAARTGAEHEVDVTVDEPGITVVPGLANTSASTG